VNREHISEDIIEAMKAINVERSVDGLLQLYHFPGENNQKALTHTAVMNGLRNSLKTRNDPAARKKFKKDMVAMAKLYSEQKGKLTLKQQAKALQVWETKVSSSRYFHSPVKADILDRQSSRIPPSGLSWSNRLRLPCRLIPEHSGGWRTELTRS
jgi:hypothetical protein